MSPTNSSSVKKLQRRVREGWSLAYAPDTRPYRRPRWQQPGKLFDLTVITAAIIAALLSVL